MKYGCHRFVGSTDRLGGTSDKRDKMSSTGASRLTGVICISRSVLSRSSATRNNGNGALARHTVADNWMVL